MYRFRVSLKHFMLMITVTVLVAAVATHYWRVATRPDVSHTIVLRFSENHVPAQLTTGDLASAINQVVPNVSERELSIITETLSLGKVRVMPYGANEIEIVASGKSWQMEYASIQLLTRVAACSIKQSAQAAGITANVVSETSTHGRLQFPKTILVDYDRIKR